MASAAMRLRAPDRQMKNNSLSLVAPAASSALVIRSEKPASILLSGHVCHSTVRTRLPISLRSGTPTKVHSARVRTSIRTDPASFARCAQTSSTGTSSMWTTSNDCTFVLHSQTALNKRFRTVCTQNQRRIKRTTSRLTRQVGPERYANTHRSYAETRDAILYKTWRRPALERWINPSAATLRTVALNSALSKRNRHPRARLQRCATGGENSGNPVNSIQQLWIAD
jgi:hypothetical protein